MQKFPKLDNTSLTATLFTFQKACHPLTPYTETPKFHQSIWYTTNSDISNK